MKNEIIIFENQNVKLEVNMKDETVWLSLDQLSKLFERDKSVISRHIKNIFNEELDDISTVAKFATVQKEGNRTIEREIEYYNLDVVISVGYRVKSQNGIIFRKWANQVLKEHLLKGYTVNEKRLAYLEKTVKLIDIATRINSEVDTNNMKEVVEVINHFSKGLDLLDDYDHRAFKNVEGEYSSKKITYSNCLELIELLKYGNDSNLFGLERSNGLESIINNIYQTFGGYDVYKTTIEKAANFLYLVVKNHAFIDGNKRIAATLFIYFLHFYNILTIEEQPIIDNNTLAAVTLLIAESDPKEKSIIIDLIQNMLGNNLSYR